MNEEQAISRVHSILLRYGIEEESDLYVLNLICKKTTIQLTHEQIADPKPQTGASPGGENNDVCRHWEAEKWSQSRFPHVTFNKNITRYPELIFPSHVICKTFHSVACNHIELKYQLRKKLNLFKSTPFVVNCLLAEGKGGFIRATLVYNTLEAFFTSAYEELMIDRVLSWCKNSQGQQVMVEQSKKLGSHSVPLESGLGRMKA